MSASQKATRPYFPQLDGVRAIAALMVMGFHFCQFKHIGGLAVFGQTGVDLFFVLSGFLITTILLAAQPGDWHEIRTFYIRRTLRIFPLYYGYLIVASLLGSAISIWYWVYLQNIALAVGATIAGPNHFWSLAVEEQFYLVWPFLVLFLPRRWLVTTLWTLIGLALVSRFILMGHGIDSFYFTISRLDGLSAGALLAVYYQREVLHQHRPLLLNLAAISAVLLCLEWWKFHARSLPLVGATKLSLGTMFYASIVGYLVVSGTHPVSRLLSASPMRFTGRISYGLYVFHPAIFGFILARIPGARTSVQLFACFVGVYLVSLVSWYAMESRFLRLKDRVAPEAAVFRDAAISVPDGVS
jgi:peptidoglycan/LPS O-acetylase OafA/YrhL